MKDCATLKELEERIAQARWKHPDWHKSAEFGLSVLKLELNELEHAINWESSARIRDEALDVAAVAMRIASGETE
jgi:NTP pyrophosphatase (non-canonical NTP hydrolase)